MFFVILTVQLCHRIDVFYQALDTRSGGKKICILISNYFLFKYDNLSQLSFDNNNAFNSTQGEFGRPQEGRIEEGTSNIQEGEC